MIHCINCGHDNPDGAKVCAQCGFTLDWVPPSTTPETPRPAEPVEVVLELAPAHLRVAPGEAATARLAGGAPASLADASWAVVGEAEPFAEAHGTGAAVEVVVRPGPHEPARTLELRVVATGGTGPASARGTVEIAPDFPVRDGGGQGDTRRGPIVAAAVAAVVALALAGWTVLVLANRHPVKVTARHGVCLHIAPNTDDASKIPLPHGLCAGPARGEIVRVRCDDAGHAVYRVASFWPWHKRWMTDRGDLVAVQSSVPGC